MNFNVYSLFKLISMSLFLRISRTILVKTESALAEPESYCMLESFQPRCQRNDVILMKSAVYGRMKIGRCLTAEEVDAHKSAVGEDPRYFGCSADVLPLLDRKCSGKRECDVRMSDISTENIKPCFPGLTVYLEVSYECISIVDEVRSCSMTASKTPAYIIGTPRICGTKSQPWILEAPIGQKINISLFDFTTSNFGSSQGKSKQQCRSQGLIVDKSGKRNASICVTGERRQKELYLSAGNVVQILFDASVQQENIDIEAEFILTVQAVGCSDIVPPEDAWLKRNNDTIVIGCYSSRQTWRLTCKGGIWAGVLGNCSKGNEYSIPDQAIDSENESAVLDDKQVLVVVAIGGVTLTICLAITCCGAVYLRRFYVQFQKKQEYKTLKFHGNSARSQSLGVATDIIGNDTSFALAQQMPTYSVYAGQGDFFHIDNVVSADNTNKCDPL